MSVIKEAEEYPVPVLSLLTDGSDVSLPLRPVDSGYGAGSWASSLSIRSSSGIFVMVLSVTLLSCRVGKRVLIAKTKTKEW